MAWRGLGALLLLIAAGGGAGYAAGAYLDQPPASAGAPHPVAASGPAYPYTPPVSVLPDPEDPPLRAPFTTRQVQLGLELFGVRFPVPRGWDRHDIGPGEARWTPPDNPDVYYLRVEQVAGQTRTPQQMVDLRIADLHDDTRITDLRIVTSSEDELSFTFVLADYRHLSVIRWVSPRGSANAELEIAATGRVTDRAGLEALVGLIAATATPVG